MEDRQIVGLLWQRAEQALDAISKKFGKRLHKLAQNILGNNRDAEEAVNDTYLALWNTIPPARPDPLSAYVYKVGRNTALKHLRTRMAQKRDGYYDVALEELSEIIPGTSTEELFDARQLGRSINDFLGTLDEESRSLFLRRYWFGDSVRELTGVFRMKENALSVRLHRIRQRLKAHLIKEGFWNEA